MEIHSINDLYGSPGKTTVSPEVLLTIAQLTTLGVTGVSRMSNVPGSVNRWLERGIGDGVRLNIQDDVVSADIYIVMKNGYHIREVSRQVQVDVARAVTEMVGMHVGRVNIHIEDIDFPAEIKSPQTQEV
jgi:uncharacterized alkaline shock family protein YloU